VLRALRETGSLETGGLSHRKEGMTMDDEFNMSMRKFLKQVGVTSQQAIEEAVRKAGPEIAGKALTARMVLTIDGLEMEHVVEGRISGPSE
jgi:hypothetical protein